MKLYFFDNLCLFGFHKWKKYFRSVPIENAFGGKTTSEFLHRECVRCGKKQLRTNLLSEFGSIDNNRWIKV